MHLLIPEVEIPKRVPLVIALHGFSDAGNAVAQMQKYLIKSKRKRLLYEFSNDDFLDYRARRPTITFENDHLKQYEPQKLGLYIAEDEIGAPFLLLTGYEPDFRWDSFVEKLIETIDRFEVSITVWVHAIPMPVPHTRPIGITVSGNRKDLVESKSVWQPTTRLAASIGHVIEHALFEKDYPVVGFALLVPHYLANTDFPDALRTSLDCLMDATGLLFSTEIITSKQTEFLKQVDEQIEANEESIEMVKNLEFRYDEYMSSLDSRDSGVKEKTEADLPTGDQLADDFERFLAEQWGNDHQGGSKESTD